MSTYSRHVWEERLGTGLNRWRDSLTNTILELTNEPTTVTQTGTPINVTWLNEMEVGIETNCNDIADLETRVGTGATDDLTQNATSVFSTGTGTDPSDSSIDVNSTVVEGTVEDLTLSGLTISNLYENANVSASVTSDGNSTDIKILNDGTLVNASNAFIASSTAQTHNLIANNVYFAYFKADDSSTGNMNDRVVIRYSGGTAQFIGDNTNGELEAYQIFTATTTEEANVGFKEGASGTIIRDYQLFIPMTDLGIEDYTEAQMLSLARQGYFDGLNSVRDFRVKSVGKNLFNLNTALINRSVNTSDGSLFIQPDDSFYASDYIRLKPNTSYRQSNARAFALYDINRSFISSGNTLTITTTNNTYFGRFTIYTLDQPLSEYQLEQGSTSTTFESYQESTQYIELPNGEELRSLPNGTVDSLSDGVLTKRIENYALQESDIVALADGGANVDRVRINKPLDSATYNNGVNFTTDYNLFFPNFRPVTFSDDVTKIGGIYVFSSTQYEIIVAKNTYADLSAAQSALTGTIINYQLDNTVFFNITANPLSVYNKGTIIIEPITIEQLEYTTNIEISNTNLTINILESIKKVDKNDNSKLILDTSDATIASDGLSFTHTELSAGDLVEFEYSYDTALTTIPSFTAAYPINISSQATSNQGAINTLSSLVTDINNFIGYLETEKADKQQFEIVQYNQYNLLLQNYYDNKFPLHRGLFFDGFANEDEITTRTNFLLDTTNNLLEFYDINTTTLDHIDSDNNMVMGQSSGVFAVGQRITVTDALNVSSVDIPIARDGNPTDNFFIEIYDENENLLETSNSIAGSTLTTSLLTTNVTFASNVLLDPGTYFFVVKRSGSVDAANHYVLGRSTDDTYLGGSIYSIDESNVFTVDSSNTLSIRINISEFKPLTGTITFDAQAFTNYSENATLYVRTNATGTTTFTPQISIDNGTANYQDMILESQETQTGAIEYRYSSPTFDIGQTVRLRFDATRSTTSDQLQIIEYGCILGVV